MRKALLIGINDYPAGYKLSGCVNDIHLLEPLLSRNGDGSPNFDVLLKENMGSSQDAMQGIQNLFADSTEVSLLYFSGHGCLNNTGAEIMFPDEIRDSGQYVGLKMTDIMKVANNSPAANRVVILDCCYAANMGKPDADVSYSALNNGVSILSACEEKQTSMEFSGNGVFTSALCNALSGQAANIDGSITLGGIYAYADSMFGAWEQRPVFKTNVSNFVAIRRVEPRVSVDILRKLKEYFPTEDTLFKLNPSYEETNGPEWSEYYKTRNPIADPHHVATFKELQQLVSVGLVRPVGENHMYWAAINNKSCCLTDVGKHYWNLVDKKRI